MTPAPTQEQRTGFLFCDLDGEVAHAFQRGRQRMALRRITAPQAPSRRRWNWWGVGK